MGADDLEVTCVEAFLQSGDEVIRFGLRVVGRRQLVFGRALGQRTGSRHKQRHPDHRADPSKSAGRQHSAVPGAGSATHGPSVATIGIGSGARAPGTAQGTPERRLSRGAIHHRFHESDPTVRNPVRASKVLLPDRHNLRVRLRCAGVRTATSEIDG